MTTNLNRYKHQQDFYDSNPDKAMLCWALGSGKTRSACEWAKRRENKGQALIICPKGLKTNWQRQADTWGLTDRMIVSKEEFKKCYNTYNNSVVIVDEADHFFSAMFKSALSKALRNYIRKHNPDLLLLTGTPYRSSPWNIYTAGSFLGHNWNFMTFKRMFFIDIHIGRRVVPKIKVGIEGQLRKLIESISLVFRPEDAFDIPPQIDEIVYVTESEKQQKMHKDNIEIQPIVRFTRAHQIEAGSECGVEDDPKLEVIIQYMETNRKIMVVCRYREQLERYRAFLTSVGGGKQIFVIHGDIVDRQTVLDNVERSEQCVLLVQSATCEGYEAPSIGIMIFASMDYSYRNYLQMKGRIHRLNRLKKNVYIHLITDKKPESCDEAIMQSMIRKEDFDVLKYART
jgi:superfamily II DNA or RNA helicase